MQELRGEINILELAKGAIQDQISAEVEKIFANISNPNTEPCLNRQVTISLLFKPDERREIISCEAKVETVLAPICSKIIISRDGEKVLTASEIQFTQAR